MARNGKIARLSLDIRTELNRRLQDGEPGTNLVEWLNRLPTVRAALREYFGGVPISIQNLSEWRQGGYQDWVRLEAARDFIDNLSEQSGELDEAAGGELISDRFGSVLAAEMAQLAMKLLEREEDLEKRWNRLKEINREFSRLRRDDHRGLRTRIKQAQWEWQQEQAEDAAEEKRRTRERVEALFGGPSGRGPSRTGHHLKEAPSGGAPEPKAEGRMQKAEVLGNAGGTPALRGESGQIKPNQTKPAKPVLSSIATKGAEPEPQGGGQSIQPNQGYGATSRIKPNQGKSDPPSQGYGAASQIQPNPRKSDQIKVNQTKPAKPGLSSEATKGKPGLTIKVEGARFKIEGSKPDEGPPEPQGGGQSGGSEPGGLPNRGGRR